MTSTVSLPKTISLPNTCRKYVHRFGFSRETMIITPATKASETVPQDPCPMQ